MQLSFPPVRSSALEPFTSCPMTVPLPWAAQCSQHRMRRFSLPPAGDSSVPARFGTRGGKPSDIDCRIRSRSRADSLAQSFRTFGGIDQVAVTARAAVYHRVRRLAFSGLLGARLPLHFYRIPSRAPRSAHRDRAQCVSPGSAPARRSLSWTDRRQRRSSCQRSLTPSEAPTASLAPPQSRHQTGTRQKRSSPGLEGFFSWHPPVGFGETTLTEKNVFFQSRRGSIQTRATTLIDRPISFMAWHRRAPACACHGLFRWPPGPSAPSG